MPETLPIGTEFIIFNMDWNRFQLKLEYCVSHH